MSTPKSRRLKRQRRIQRILDDYIANTVMLLHPDLSDFDQFELYDQERGFLYTKLAEAGLDVVGFEYDAYRTNTPPDPSSLKIKLQRGRSDQEIKQALKQMRAKKGEAEKQRKQLIRKSKP